MRILVVDDEPQITRVLRASLASSGYEVLLARDGVEAFDLFRESAPDLVITDLFMPRMDGIELTRAIRQIGDTPIIVLSVREQETMKVAALDEGADDYVTKPFSMQELLARVRAQLRKSARQPQEATQISVGDFEIDTEQHSVRVRQQEVHLTPERVRATAGVCTPSKPRSDSPDIAEGRVGCGGRGPAGVSSRADRATAQEDRDDDRASIHPQ